MCVFCAVWPSLDIYVCFGVCLCVVRAWTSPWVVMHVGVTVTVTVTVMVTVTVTVMVTVTVVVMVTVTETMFLASCIREQRSTDSWNKQAQPVSLFCEAFFSRLCACVVRARGLLYRLLN